MSLVQLLPSPAWSFHNGLWNVEGDSLSRLAQYVRPASRRPGGSMLASPVGRSVREHRVVSGMPRYPKARAPFALVLSMSVILQRHRRVPRTLAAWHRRHTRPPWRARALVAPRPRRSPSSCEFVSPVFEVSFR